MFKRATNDRCCGVVHNQRYAMFAANGGNFGDWKYLQFRIGQGFGIKCAGAFVNGIGEALRIVGINKPNLNAHVFHGIGEQVPCAAIKVCR